MASNLPPTTPLANPINPGERNLDQVIEEVSRRLLSLSHHYDRLTILAFNTTLKAINQQVRKEFIRSCYERDILFKNNSLFQRHLIRTFKRMEVYNAHERELVNAYTVQLDVFMTIFSTKIAVFAPRSDVDYMNTFIAAWSEVDPNRARPMV